MLTAYVRFYYLLSFFSAVVYEMHLKVLLLLVFQIVVHRQVQIAEEERKGNVAGRMRATEGNCEGGAKKIQESFFGGHRSYNLFSPLTDEHYALDLLL